jgi:hypothetical protein
VKKFFEKFYLKSRTTQRGTVVTKSVEFGMPLPKKTGRDKHVELKVSLGPRTTLAIFIILLLAAIYGVSWVIGVLLGFGGSHE